MTAPCMCSFVYIVCVYIIMYASVCLRLRVCTCERVINSVAVVIILNYCNQFHFCSTLDELRHGRAHSSNGYVSQDVQTWKSPLSSRCRDLIDLCIFWTRHDDRRK